MKISYLVSLERTTSGTFAHQVLDFMSRLSESRDDSISLIVQLPLLDVTRRGVHRGTSVAVRRQIESGLPTGVAVHILPNLIPCSLYYMPIWLVPVYILASVPQLLVLLLALRPDVLHCRSDVSALPGVMVRYLLPRHPAVVFDCRSLYAEEAHLLGLRWFDRASYVGWKAIRRFLLQHSDCVTCVTPELGRALTRMSGGSRVYTVPAIVSGDRFKPNDALRDSVRQELHFAPEDRVLVFSGTLGSWHSASTLERIWRYYRSATSWLVLLVPNGRAVRASLGVDDQVRILAIAPDQVSRYLCAADYGIVPFHEDLSSDAILLGTTMISSKAEEYMMAGLRIIVNSRVTPLARLVGNHRIGIVVDMEAAPGSWPELETYDSQESWRIHTIANGMFSDKSATIEYRARYSTLVERRL